MSRRKYDRVEVLMIVLVTALVAFASGRAWQLRQPLGDGMLAEGQQQLRDFARRYGAHASRNAEEWIIRDFFNDRRGGFFLDIGAADYKSENNTYFLETVLGWRGLAIDAQTAYAADWAANRPGTRFFAYFVSDHSERTRELYVPADYGRFGATGDRRALQEPSFTVQQVRTITLNDLLAREGVEHVDFVSLDIEQAEPLALAGFDIARYAPELLCVEAQPQVRQAILEYFHRHQYVLVGRYLPADPLNLYFMPATAP
jgi:FkbM family methyltransferase